jgi:hypothetical protein
LPGEGSAAGAIRNVLMLATAGELIVTSDDDISCTLWSDHERDGVVTLSGHRDPRRHRFYETRELALPGDTIVGVDLIQCFNGLIGLPVDAIVRTSASCDAGGACEDLLDAAASLGAPTVRIVYPGLAGDNGVDCPYRLLFSTGNAREQMASDSRLCRVALRSREVRRSVTTVTITHDPWCMLGCAALDNRHLFPPFVRLGRGEDGLFGIMTSVCNPPAFFAHIPHGVVHHSSRPPSYTRRDIASASRTRTTEVLSMLMHSCHIPRFIADPAARMRRLGQHLCEIGRLRRSEFVPLVRESVLEVRSWELKRIEADLNSASCSTAWRESANRYRETYLASAQHSEFSLPIEFRSGHLDSDSERFRAFVRSFGELVAAWPEIVSVAHRSSPGMLHDACAGSTVD